MMGFGPVFAPDSVVEYDVELREAGSGKVSFSLPSTAQLVSTHWDAENKRWRILAINRVRSEDEQVEYDGQLERYNKLKDVAEEAGIGLDELSQEQMEAALAVEVEGYTDDNEELEEILAELEDEDE